jgi:hypothetical protein
MAKTCFGEEFTRIQESLGLTNRQLAELVYGEGNCNTSVVSRLRRYGRESEPANGKKPWKPKPDTLKRFFEAMNLSYYEQVYLYGLAGMIPQSETPSATDVETAFGLLEGEIAKHPYPAYVLDNQYFRFWAVNSAAARLVGGEERLDELKNCSVFDLAFSEKWGFTKAIAPETLTDLRASQVVRFKLLNLLRRHEPFYMDYPELLQETLTDEEYKKEHKGFESFWEGLNPAESTFLNVTLTLNLGDHKMRLNVQSEPMYQLGLKDFFSLVRYYPVDSESQAVAREFFEGCEKKCIFLWKMQGATTAERMGLKTCSANAQNKPSTLDQHDRTNGARAHSSATKQPKRRNTLAKQI